MVEELRKSLSDRKPATLWNALELLRRIINFGVKTNRCPNLAFQIEMPIKDNEVIEHLTPGRNSPLSGLCPHMARPRCGQYALAGLFYRHATRRDVQTTR